MVNVGVYQRRVVRAGGGLVVFLPPAWLRAHHLSRGDVVELVARAGELVVRVVSQPSEEEPIAAPL
jgi:antitoxin component of MazEF toxin-antitoxin module